MNAVNVNGNTVQVPVTTDVLDGTRHCPAASFFVDVCHCPEFYTGTFGPHILMGSDEGLDQKQFSVCIFSAFAASRLQLQKASVILSFPSWRARKRAASKTPSAVNVSDTDSIYLPSGSSAICLSVSVVDSSPEDPSGCAATVVCERTQARHSDSVHRRVG